MQRFRWSRCSQWSCMSRRIIRSHAKFKGKRVYFEIKSGRLFGKIKRRRDYLSPFCQRDVGCFGSGGLISGYSQPSPQAKVTQIPPGAHLGSVAGTWLAALGSSSGSVAVLQEANRRPITRSMASMPYYIASGNSFPLKPARGDIGAKIRNGFRLIRDALENDAVIPIFHAIPGNAITSGGRTRSFIRRRI